MFLILSFLKAFCIVKKNLEQNDKEELLKALNVLDTGIVMGSGYEVDLLTEFAQILHEHLGEIIYKSNQQKFITFFNSQLKTIHRNKSNLTTSKTHHQIFVIFPSQTNRQQSSSGQNIFISIHL
jgi:hypothetical protein